MASFALKVITKRSNFIDVSDTFFCFSKGLKYALRSFFEGTSTTNAIDYFVDRFKLILWKSASQIDRPPLNLVRCRALNPVFFVKLEPFRCKKVAHILRHRLLFTNGSKMNSQSALRGFHKLPFFSDLRVNMSPEPLNLVHRLDIVLVIFLCYPNRRLSLRRIL